MAILYDAAVYASVLAVLCAGLTLTYRTSKIPNFAHASFAVLGMYASLLLTGVLGIDIYATIPAAFGAAGAASLLMYWAIIRPMQRRGASTVSLMFVTLAFDIVMVGVLNIVADFAQAEFLLNSRGFTLRSLDHELAGAPAALPASLAAVAALAAGLHRLLHHTAYGTRVRAAIENRRLAVSLGIDADRTFAGAWFLSGGLAGAAGVLMAVWFQGEPELAIVLLPSIFAGSVVGGLAGVPWAIAGGLLIGAVETLGMAAAADALGYWVVQYRPAVPMVAMIAVLLAAPGGLARLGAALRGRREW